MQNEASMSSPLQATSASPPPSPTIHASYSPSSSFSRSPTPSSSHPNDFLPRPSLPPSTSSPPPAPPLPRTITPHHGESMNCRTGDSITKHDLSELSIRPRMPPSSASAPAATHGSLPRLLPLDPSAYSNAHIPFPAWTHSTTSLSELAHLIRNQRYEEQRRSQSRIRLHRWLVSAALSARLLRCGELAYKTLVDCFRDDDKKGFATLHAVLHDVRASCDATRSYAILEPDLESSKFKSHSVSSADASLNTFSTFMHEIPLKFRNDILDFISQIRTNPDFLATRLCSLSQHELLKLTSFRPSVDIMAFGKQSVKRGALATTGGSVERLLSFQRHDGLSALLFTVFANSAGPDSYEDIRRTDIWATACARLISEGRPGHDRLIGSVLDAFAGMRDWPVKHKLELFLMQALQEGQFLLEKPEESTGDGRPHQEKPVNKPLEYATEEFFDRSVKRLFALIDSEPSAGGLPEGVIEIGHAILKKLALSKKLRVAAEITILVKWFFRCYLPHALIYPETHGILVGYHVSTFARERILSELSHRICLQAIATWNNVRQSVVVMPEVRNNMENLRDRLRRPRAHGRPVLLPAKTVTAPKETMEVHPYLVLCPSDIKTLIFALFPERRAHLAIDSVRPGLSSSASSMSGISIPARGASTPGDGSSILSQSVSSVTSDATSHAPLLGEKSQSTESLNLLQRESTVRPGPSDEYGRRLRIACDEMSRVLGEDVVKGICHPFADRWAVLHISPDGRQLSTRMKKDIEEEGDSEDESLDSDTEDEGNSYGFDLGNDYNQLKESVVKLLSEYEVPKFLSDSRAFSNGRRQQRQRRQTNGLRNTTPVAADDQTLKQLYVAHEPEPSKERAPDLVIMLDAAFHQCNTREEYVDAMFWYRTLESLQKIPSPSLRIDGYAPLLHYFSRGARHSLSRCISAIEEFEAWFVWLGQSQERHASQIDEMMVKFKNLRDKMWYKTAVLTSARYEEAKNVALALKQMGRPQKAAEDKAAAAHRRSKSAATTIFHKSETQTYDLLAAAPQRGGPNKLTDEQVVLTNNWLLENCVEADFCKGEERIHRFCMEIDRCINRLVAENVLDGPVLWSSELFRRDKDILDGGKQDFWLVGAGLILPVDDDLDTKSSGPHSMSLDFVQRSSKGSPRIVSTQTSQQSFSSALSHGGKTVTSSNSGLDYFGVCSPALAIDPKKTFWSPFQSNEGADSKLGAGRSSNPPSKSTNTKPKTPPAMETEKRRFLLDLKQTLTGLLLSDLGIILFSRGCETDKWFGEEYTEDCIGLIEAEVKRKKMKLLRKKKERDQQKASNPSDAPNYSDRTTPTLSNPSPSLLDVDNGGRENAGASGNEAPRGPLASTKKPLIADFPYNPAYHLLLRKFAIHPNPFVKLHALYELRILVEQSLAVRAGKPIVPRNALPPVPPSPSLGDTPELSNRKSAVALASRPQNLREAVAHVTERRSHSINALQRQSGNGTTPVRPSGSPSKDPIIDALQTLLRDSKLRPKTLFRDLQYIASFVPAKMLDRTARGKAFWDVALAALGLKQDVVQHMVEIADDIVTNESVRTHKTLPPESAEPGILPSSKTAAISPAPELAKYSVTDAARMYLITAKEGDAAAERELAIFYLTYTQEDLNLPRTILPLTQGRDVFKGTGKDKTRTGNEVLDNAQATMCLARHWMEMSCAGGDELAAGYLKGKDDMDSIQRRG